MDFHSYDFFNFDNVTSVYNEYREGRVGFECYKGSLDGITDNLIFIGRRLVYSTAVLWPEDSHEKTLCT